MRIVPVTSPAIPVAAPPLQSTNAAAAPAAATATGQAQLSSSLQGMLAAAQAQRSSPEAIARRRITGRMLIEGSNPDIGEALGLTAEQADKLLELLVTHRENSSAVFQSTTEGNLPTSVEERSARLLAQRQADEAELQAMLGSKYSQWKDYNETRQAWQQRRDLRAVLDAGGIPMSDAQSKSLIAALSAEQRDYSQQTRNAISQGGPSAMLPARYSPERRQRLLDTAAPHLTQQQLEGYRGMLERAAAQEQATRSTLQTIQTQAQAQAQSEASAAAASSAR